MAPFKRIVNALQALYFRSREISDQLQFPNFIDHEMVLNADLWTDKPEILSAMVGVDSNYGVGNGLITPENRQAVLDAGGTWNDDLPEICPVSGERPDYFDYSSAVPKTLIELVADCNAMMDVEDGFPVCFSWPMIPSSVKREHFLYYRSDGEVLQPKCASIVPNVEWNERHCVVLFGQFINRVTPDSPNPQDQVYTEKLEIVGDLKLVGFGGEIVSAKGMVHLSNATQTPYLENASPTFVGLARLTKATDVGEGATRNLNIMYSPGRNSAIAVYGERHDPETLYIIKLFYGGGMTPDGTTALHPDHFDDYFQVNIVHTDGKTESIMKANVEVPVMGGSITVLGLAELGAYQEEGYDACYDEDFDNYIDIVLKVQGDDHEFILKQVESVLAFGPGKGILYNPGGPGHTPNPGTEYTKGSPRNQLVPIRLDLENRYQATYCEHRRGWISTDIDTCLLWFNRNRLRELSLGTLASDRFFRRAVLAGTGAGALAVLLGSMIWYLF